MNTGSPEHGVQAIIDEALAFGSANYGKPYTGKSELHNILERNARAAIVGLALGHVMRQRTGEKCGDKNLAYADHYLQARVMVAYLGPSGYHVAKSAVVGYEALKKVFDMLGILHALASDNQCPEPVKPDLTSMEWGTRGCDDGMVDYLVQVYVGATALAKWATAPH